MLKAGQFPKAHLVQSGTTFALSPLSSSGHVVAPVAPARFYLCNIYPRGGAVLWWQQSGIVKKKVPGVSAGRFPAGPA
jgi:hypothetical protein